MWNDLSVGVLYVCNMDKLPRFRERKREREKEGGGREGEREGIGGRGSERKRYIEREKIYL